VTEQVRIRLSVQNDLAALVRLEQTAFSTDRFSTEHVDYMLARARATIFIAEVEGQVYGAAYLLWRRNSPRGRLYNFAVEPDHQQQGIGRRLLQECETEAVRRGCSELTLEVRPDNEGAIAFYRKFGYQTFKISPNFYDDGSPAIRLRKSLTLNVPAQIHHQVPYYAQTLEFTCGAACLIMVMKHFRPEGKYNRTLEMNLGKEATLIFMTSGIGGTGPFGLALAAARRHFPVRVLSSMEKAPFVHSVRIPQKRTVIRVLHEDMKNEALQRGVAASTCDFTFDDIRSALLQGWIPISLISTYRLSGFRQPHWVVISGFDRRHVYLLDPYEQHLKASRHREVKIAQTEFFRMSRYGKDVYRCTLLVGPPDPLCPDPKC